MEQELSNKLVSECYDKLLSIKDKYQVSLQRPVQLETETDFLDRAVSEQRLQTSNLFRNRMKQTLEEIERALRKFSDNTYGICEITGDPIEPKRLLAVPWTRVSLRALEDQAS